MPMRNDLSRQEAAPFGAQPSITCPCCGNVLESRSITPLVRQRMEGAYLFMTSGQVEQLREALKRM